MKILVANKYLYPRGGDCLYTLRLMDLLRGAGHQVIPFTMKHTENIKTGFENYFVDYIDFREEVENLKLSGAVRVTARSIINKQAAEQMNRIIEDHRPDIVHLNNIHHQLTPSILQPAAKRNIPIVWTLHDHILTCPDHLHLRNGSVCLKCAGGDNYHAIVHRCKKGSFGASLLAALESSYYKPEKLWSMVNRFICPSRFMVDFLTDKGFPPGRLFHIPNFSPPLKSESYGQDYFLYFGRLSEEKGIHVLLKAMSILDKGRLVIAGDGPAHARLREIKDRFVLNNVEFVGRQTSESIFRLISGSLAVIAPSICLENLPYAIIESTSSGKPVIGSRIGGIPELIDHGRTGLLFEPGNAVQLAECMSRLLSDKALAARMGAAAKTKADNKYSPESHLKALIELYTRAIGIYPSKKKTIPHNYSHFEPDKVDRMEEYSYGNK